MLNPSLVRKLETDFRLTLNLPESGDNDLDLNGMLDHVRSIVRKQRSWSVSTGATLGIFSFSKYAMYQDLEANRERFSAHHVLRMLAKDESAFDFVTPEMPTAEHLDREVHPREMFQVLDADATQLEAIEAVKRGANLIIQGPPGTGKSQTITNIIAELLAQRKTVLFVSEKMAALQVVAKRLDEAGLQEFYLEAHSQDIKKAEIVKELDRAMMNVQVIKGVDTTVELEQIAKMRRELNRYVDQLHDTNNPLGSSVYAAHGKLAALHDAPALHFPLDDIASLSKWRLVSAVDVVDSLVRVGPVLFERDSHPWNGCILSSATPQVRSELESRLRHVAEAARDVKTTQDQIRSALGLPEGHSLPDANWLLALQQLLAQRLNGPDHWIEMPSLDPVRTLVEDSRDRAVTYLRRWNALRESYAEGFFALDLDTHIAVLQRGAEPIASRVVGEQAPPDRAIQQRDRLDARLYRAREALTSLVNASRDAATHVGLPVPVTMPGVDEQIAILRMIVGVPRVTSEWLDPERWPTLKALVAEASRQSSERKQVQQWLKDRFLPQFTEVATSELLDRFERSHASPLRSLKPRYRKDMHQVQQFSTTAVKLGYQEVRLALREVQRQSAIDDWFASNTSSMRAAFGSSLYNGLNTNWSDLDAALEATCNICDQLGSIPPQLEALLTGQAGSAMALQPLLAALETALTEARVAIAGLLEVLRIQDARGVVVSADFTPIQLLSTLVDESRLQLKEFWQAYDEVQAQYKPSNPTVNRLLADLREGQTVRQLLAELDADDQRIRAAIGAFYNGLDTDWNAVLSALNWIQRVRDLFNGSLPAAFAVQLRDPAVPDSLWKLLAHSVADLDRLLSLLRPAFTNASFQASGVTPESAALRDVEEWAAFRHQHVSRLEEWIDLSVVIGQAEAAGLTGFVDAIIKDRIAPELWVSAFERQVNSLWLSWRYEEVPALNRFRGGHHNNVIQKFRELDEAQFRANSRRIQVACMAMRPHAPHAAHPTSEPGILRRDATRRRRFRPLRKLFADLPTLLPALKPCMLMSPLSVSQYLGDSPISFDVVIFDEASQILPADAVGSIARGKQVVVVGDEHQLPPTNFFRVSVDLDESDDDDDELPESILDACLRAGLPVKPLRWHYRSRHEDLIAFSNHKYYDGKLITFPSPDTGHRSVEFVHVLDGKYKDRRNSIEALRVVDAIVDHARHHPQQSLGVITFSATQEETIDHALNARKRLEPDLEQLLRSDGTDGFFIKNLENVQGDERDVIFFSVGYGPDESDQMRMHFGPLSQKGGERRLNVAVTRARQHVKVFASFLPDRIDKNRITAKGSMDLRSYLEYAQRGPIALEAVITSEGGEAESPFEEAVAAELRRHDLTVVTQVGVGGYRIDMAIRDSEASRFLLGIECDGATYHSSRTARDRDRLRQTVLENLGWTIHRIWSTDWLKNPEREVQNVLSALERARQSPTEQPVRPNPQTALPERTAEQCPPPDPAIRPSATSPTPKRARPTHPEPTAASANGSAGPIRYTSAILTPRNRGYELTEAPMNDIADLVEKCVAVEFPVHTDRVIKAVSEAYDIQRVRENARSRVQVAIESVIHRGKIERRGAFLWMNGNSNFAVRHENEFGVSRPIAHIAPEEIALAVKQVIGRSYAMPRADIGPQVAREIGYNRTSAAINDAIQRIVESLLSTSVLKDIGGQISMN